MKNKVVCINRYIYINIYKSHVNLFYMFYISDLMLCDSASSMNIISTYLWTSAEIRRGCTMLTPACERTDHPSRSSVMMETQILAVCHQISGEKAVWSLDYWRTTTRTLQQLPHTTTASIIYTYFWSVFCIFNQLSMKFFHYILIYIYQSVMA